VVNKFVYREKLKNIGLRMPENKLRTILLMLLAMIVFVPLMVYFGTLRVFELYYSLHGISLFKGFLVLAVMLPAYYFCEEFFIRGFMLFSLWKRVKWHSIWITDLVFTLAHIFKPPLEVIAAIPVGVALGFLTLATRSVYPAMVVHYSMGVAMIVTANHYF